MLLQVEDISKSFGDRLLFENVSFSIDTGERYAIVAQNGAGKSTLLKIITGSEAQDSGSVTFQRDTRVTFLSQTPEFPTGATISEACFHTKNADIDQTAEQYHVNIKQILGKLDIHDLNQKIETLSGGQQKRIALANVLISEPDLLILDEPTNHLDLQMIEWLEDMLKRSKMALLIVTHDRYFLDSVCTDILEISEQQLFHYKGNYSYYLEKREERISNFNAVTERMRNLYRKELEWMRRMPQARGHKARYRTEAFEALDKRAHEQIIQDNVQLNVKSSYIGSKIFEAQYISKAFGDRVLLKDFYYNFSRYEKMGIIGANGTGKSTFVKMLVGEVEPDSGRFDIGETVRFAYYSQTGMKVNEGERVIDAIRNVAEVVDLGGGRKLTAAQMLNHFLFPHEKQYDYIEKLSGGERRRLNLCMVLMMQPNFLVLDEPTNDLDITTLNILEEYLINFKGCVIVVSHDRYFMDRIVDHLLVFKGGGEVKDFPGNYTDYRMAEKSREKNVDKIVSHQNETEKRERKHAEVKKLSYKEQREYDMLEKELGELEKEKRGIEEFLAHPEGGDMNAQLARYKDVKDMIDEKEMRWLEIAEKLS